jgi:uncharacterized protein YjbI with pentapeptide repeats
MRDTDLTMTHFQRADLHGADFTGSKLDRAELADADLSGTIGLGTADFGLGIDAQRANFRRADLRDARIPGQYFEGADFHGADLRGAFLAGRFHGARFDDADVQGTVMLGAIGIEPLHTDLRSRGAIVTTADFVLSVRGGRDYSGCDLHGFSLEGADLAGVSFRRASFHSAMLQGASLRQAQCNHALFCWAKLNRADLSQSDLQGANFTGADLTEADLTKANCREATFGNSRLVGATLAGTDLTGADLRGADLTGADLTGATLTGVRWDAAVIANLKGVTPEEQAAIKSQAARWKHDLAAGFQKFANGFSVPGWVIAWPCGFLVLYFARRKAPGHPSLRLFAVLHTLAALPVLAFLFLVLAGASPTAQLSGSMDGWSNWVALWPLAYCIALVALTAFVPSAIIAWGMSFRFPVPGLKPRLAAMTVLTGLSLAASLGCVRLLAPTA